MRLFFLFFCLITSSLLLAQEKAIKNEWPFYFFGPLTPWKSKELLDHKTAQAKICKYVPSNCNLDKSKEDGHEYLYLIIELKENPTKVSPLSGLLVLFSGKYFDRGETDQKLSFKQEIEKSFILDVKGQRIPFSDYSSIKGDYLFSYYRVQNVVPEPVSGEEKDYWLSFSHPSSLTSKLWFHRKTKVYDLKFSKVTYLGKEGKESLNNLKLLIPDIESRLKGKRFEHFLTKNDRKIKLNNFHPFYITGYEDGLFHLQIPYTNSPIIDFFKIIAPPEGRGVVIQAPSRDSDSLSPGIDESKHSKEFNWLESPCLQNSIYWKTLLGEKKYPPLVIKIKLDDLMDGNKFKSFIEIKGPNNPKDWYIEGDYEWQRKLRDRANIQFMSEETLKSGAIKGFKPLRPQFDPILKKITNKKYLLSLNAEEYSALLENAIDLVRRGYIEYQEIMKHRYFMRDFSDEQYEELRKESWKKKEKFCEKNQNKKK